VNKMPSARCLTRRNSGHLGDDIPGRFVLVLMLLVAATPARAALHVVSSIPTLGSFAKEVGGDRVDVVSLGKGYQDPHFIEPKPSLMVQLNKADLLVFVGLELEIGWLPPLVS
jgi:zinc/manganese transport system substrate-binding protein